MVTYIEDSEIISYAFNESITIKTPVFGVINVTLGGIKDLCIKTSMIISDVVA